MDVSVYICRIVCYNKIDTIFWKILLLHGRKQERIFMQPIPLKEGDILLMKKKHPCGGELFKLLRVGSDLRIACCSCGRDVTVSRLKLEPNIKKVNP